MLPSISQSSKYFASFHMLARLPSGREVPEALPLVQVECFRASSKSACRHLRVKRILQMPPIERRALTPTNTPNQIQRQGEDDLSNVEGKQHEAGRFAWFITRPQTRRG